MLIHVAHFCLAKGRMNPFIPFAVVVFAASNANPLDRKAGPTVARVPQKHAVCATKKPHCSEGAAV